MTSTATPGPDDPAAADGRQVPKAIAAAEDGQCIADLRRVDMFGDLSGEHLEWVLNHAECLHLETGDPLWIEGEPAEAMFVVLTGQIQILFEVSGQQVRLTSDKWGGVIGVLPYSRMTEHRGKTWAMGPSRVLQIRREHFSEMLYKIPELGYRLVALMSDRVREGTRFEQRREKMMALGKLSAGLAHELNNPAAAVARAAADLAEGLERSNDRAARLASIDVDGDLVARMIGLRETKCPDEPLTTLERGEAEDELADWLDDHGIEDGYMVAESLVAAGITADKIEAAAEGSPTKRFPTPSAGSKPACAPASCSTKSAPRRAGSASSWPPSSPTPTWTKRPRKLSAISTAASTRPSSCSGIRCARSRSRSKSASPTACPRCRFSAARSTRSGPT
ncbi:MAG: cyclic nucleotide-binding domain-containing protein [Acidobacteriota bacterium]